MRIGPLADNDLIILTVRKRFQRRADLFGNLSGALSPGFRYKDLAARLLWLLPALIILIHKPSEAACHKKAKCKDSKHHDCQQNVFHAGSPSLQDNGKTIFYILKHFCTDLRSPRTSKVMLSLKIISGVTVRFIFPLCLTAMILIP